MLNILGRGPDHDFNQPLGLLSDCHRRIETFLGVLLRVAREKAGRTLDPDSTDALRKAKKYFVYAAPKHTADEEESLFPRMREVLPADASSRADIERLHGDHDDANALHARVDELLGVWLGDGVLPGEQAAELIKLLENLDVLYREHIRVEESVVFPLAGKVLSDTDLLQVGAEMRARRGLKAPG
jgi:hemerythrin-like domain-containing protein